jgi:peptide/nickel transport system substrate-binding protein/oligopeptide transport system substrate-binding protein
VHRSLRLLAALIAVAGLGATACSSSSSHTSATTTFPHSGGTLRLAVVGLNTWQPGLIVPTNQAEMIAVDLLDEGLTSIDPATNHAAPALATTWSTEVSGSGAEARVGTTWTFQLDPAARFTDGSKVTAGDVVKALTAVASQGSSTLAGARLDVVQGYDELVTGKTDTLAGLHADGDKVVVTTDQPDAELPLLLASPVYAVTKSGNTTPPTSGQSEAPVAPLGTGPFKVASDDGTTVKLVRTTTSHAQLDEVDLIRFKDTSAAVAAVHSGQADWAAVPPDKKSSATGGSIGYTVQAPLGAEQFFGINLASPTFANPFFRQAIIKSIDRNSLVATVLPGLHVSSGVVPPGVPGSVPDACGATCEFDRNAARQLLHRAFPGGRIPIVEIDTDADPTNVELARTVAVNLEAVRIPTQVKVHSFSQYQRFITSGRQQLFRTGWVGLWPSAGAYLEPLFRSNSLDNSTAFKSTHIDGALTLTAALADADARATQYEAIQRTIISDAVVVPIASYTQVIALASKVQHYAARLDGTFDVDTVEVSG